MLGIASAALPLFIWMYLLWGRGRFWSVRRHRAEVREDAPIAFRKIEVVIPARNEADGIGRAVHSLLNQRFYGRLHITVVDDGSTDGTADTARDAANYLERGDELTVTTAPPLQPGWTGKMWAVAQGVAAIKSQPDFLMLTDADIDHAPENLATLISIAASRGFDLVSVMVRLQNRSVAERLLIPAFVFFFFLLYPPGWIRNPHRKTAGAAGGCMLVNPRRLAQAGGIAAIRNELIDDCALARAIKRSGGSVWLGLTADAVSSRVYHTFGEIERMIARTAFYQLRHSALLLAATLLGLLVTYALPLVLIVAGSVPAKILGLAAWVLMTGAYLPTVQFYGQRPWWALTLPLASFFYAAATIDSAVKFWSGRGGEWKGRAQDV